ncbi:MAG: Ig-like domain-containing protein [Fermentimonas sp.]
MDKIRISFTYKYALLAAVFGFVFAFYGCDDDDNVEPSIVLEDTSITFYPDAGTNVKQVTFNSTEAWELEPIGVDWLKITPTSGRAGKNVLEVRMTEEKFTEMKDVDVTIVSMGVRQSFKVKVDGLRTTGVIFDNPPTLLRVGDKRKLTYLSIPDEGSVESVSWKSSAPNIISVDGEGNVEALSDGKATIGVTLNDSLTASCDIESSSEGVLSLKMLSENDSYPVTFEDGAYVVEDNLVIEEGTILRILEDNVVMKIKNKVEINVVGEIDFSPKGQSTIMRYDDSSEPKPIKVTGDLAGATIKNMKFVGVAFNFGAGKPVVIDNSEFSDVTIKKPVIELYRNSYLVVTNCKFMNNAYPVLSSAANSTSPMLFKDNYLFKNSAIATNRPQINAGIGGDYPVEIIGNEVIGIAKAINRGCGCISVSNLMGMGGTNKVVISGNKVRDARFGITTNGMMDVEIKDNEIYDNKYEPDPNNGGSAISIYSGKSTPKVIISGNIMKGNLWGVTLIGDSRDFAAGPDVNMGNLTEGEDYNVGKNQFLGNGHDGVLYELVNNSPNPVSAVNNIWGNNLQSEEEIEKLITHKKDDPKLGEVTFMPPYRK